MQKNMETSRVAFDYGPLSQCDAREDCNPNTLEVTIEVSGLPGGHDIAEALHNSLSARSMRDLPAELSVARIEKAFEAVLYIRILQLDHKFVKDRPALHYSRVRYPSLLTPVFAAVGPVEDEEHCIRCNIEAKEPLKKWDTASESEWDDVESTLLRLVDFGIGYGLEMATALPKDTTGRLSILAMVEASDRLTSVRRGEIAGDLIIRSLLGLVMTKQALGIPHVEYDSIKSYRRQYADLINTCYRR